VKLLEKLLVDVEAAAAAAAAAAADDDDYGS
jgi:hypothetical protein